MKFLIIPDSFKESMTSLEACNAIEKGIRKVIKNSEIIKIPIADGGEGTTKSIVLANNGKIYKKFVTGPLGNLVEAEYGIFFKNNKKYGIIEMAEAAGLELVPLDKRNPLKTTTYGVGELLINLLDENVDKIIVGIGGSATNDVGIGMLQALGGKFFDEKNEEIKFGGENLIKIKSIDLTKIDKRLENVDIEVACDVTNILFGENGATRVFARQKGATNEMIESLEKGVIHYSNILRNIFQKDVSNISGSGAAGGLGSAFLLIGGKLKSGIDIVLDFNNFDEKVKDVDYIFTGEGSIDNQTVHGKVISGIARRKQNKKLIVFAGRVGDVDKLYEIGVDSIFCILNEVCDLEFALKNGSINLEKAVENVVRIIK